MCKHGATSNLFGFNSFQSFVTLRLNMIMSRIICIPLSRLLAWFYWLVVNLSGQFIIYPSVRSKHGINHVWQVMASFVSCLKPNLLTAHGRLPQTF